MPRPHRIHLPGGYYHATLRGNHRQDIFHRDCERTLLNKIVARALEKHQARIHAYCWMTNHLHFLVQIGDGPLGGLMRQIASEYARAFQLRLETTGHLFENRYHATLVDTDAYLLEALRYVHQNPVRAKLVSNAVDYRWSSHSTYLSVSTGDSWVTTDTALGLFSDDRARATLLYRAFIDSMPTPEVAAELESLEKGAPLLSKKEFLKEPAPTRKTAGSLDETILAACRHFAVTLDEMRSPLRTARLVAAREWVARTATSSGFASLSAVARALSRDQSTLRSAIRRHARNIERAIPKPLMQDDD